MSRISMLLILILGSVGCNACRRLQRCAEDSCSPAANCPSTIAPDAAAQSTPTPTPPPAAAQSTPAPTPPPAAAQSTPTPPAAVPQAAAPQQQQLMFPQAAPGMMMPAFPQGQMMMPVAMSQASPFNMQGATVTTSPGRTRLAFSLSSIQFRLPWIKATPMQGPQEITMHVPAPQMQQQQIQPQMFFQGQSQMMMPTPYMLPQGQMMPGMQGPFVGAQGFPQNFQLAGAQNQQLVCPPCPPTAPNTGVTPERVQKLTAQILELEEQLKKAAAAPAKEPPKVIKDGM